MLREGLTKPARVVTCTSTVLQAPWLRANAQRASHPYIANRLNTARSRESLGATLARVKLLKGSQTGEPCTITDN